MRLYEKLLVMRQCAPRYGDLVKMALYEPPYTIDQIRKEYGDDVADRLSKDPVHKWRADTGIELIHREPDIKEFVRIVKNWKLMDGRMRAESDKKSKELFGKGNMERVKELMEEYAGARLNKKAQAVDPKKWPDYEEYQKKRHDKSVELVRRLVERHYKKMRPWGAKTENGFLTHEDIGNGNRDDIIVRGGKNILRQRRGTCHELSNARLKLLRDAGIDARRLFNFYGVGQDNDGVLGHSMVLFRGDDGKLHFANPHMNDRKRRYSFGSFDSVEDAVKQYVAVMKDRKLGGNLSDDDYVEIYDTTDMDVPDKIMFRDFLHKALEQPQLYVQGK